MPRIRLLLIEDDLADQIIFKRFVKLRRLAYDYDIASSVAQASALLKSRQYQIVLADHSLGDGTAFDLLPQIPANTPTIFVTGSGDEEIAVKALKRGAADYLSKDVQGDYLKLLPLIIDNVLKSKAAEQELEIYRQRLEQQVEDRTRALRQEISERLQAEEKLIQEKERALVTLKSIGDAVITTDENGLIEFVNPIAEKLTGWPHHEAKGLAVDKVFYTIDEISRTPLSCPVRNCLRNGEIVYLSRSTLLLDRQGQEYSIQDSAAPIIDNDGKVQGVVLVFSDVTESRRLAQELEYQASHDSLTGLVNRREFENRLNKVMSLRHEMHSDYAFCYLDLDQFKIINDTCGHTAGDELLKQLTLLLQDKIRSRDTLARLGGDEFGVLMEHCSLEQAERIANLLREEIADYRFNWEDKSFRIGVSMGLIEITDEFHNLNDLLIVADSCCYAAKDAGRNQVFIYHKNDEEIRLRSGQMQWVAKLHEALDHDRFVLYKQPIQCIHASEGEHFETLLRINDHIDTDIQPGAFIPAAERYGLMDQIDQYVIKHCLTWYAEHSKQLDNLALCTINLSGHTLGAKGVLDSIYRQFEYFALPSEKFCFEITETAAIANLNLATDFMRALKAKGCLFALDDFGSGLSSFAYLKNLPVDFLKIDGMFVKDICDDRVDLAMVKSINEIGHLLGKKTIAEFVETQCIYDQVVELGIDYAQGYWIAKPQPFTD
ncbi:EAL domain-containing protein [Methylomarinum sp. Ch1-1]|uniref:EAL domain-containing protein n=1 Tax=Methylomarinum roseum TaxID=3067653 RepID=A0AAU7NWK3_9GAMM|nr:EAL domain-containing protein [Methylomarinum sp. Ch1-1]MDP4522566.1 EAL domain-containing protein [Methylomarinum sp. Ch1-1]